MFGVYGLGFRVLGKLRCKAEGLLEIEVLLEGDLNSGGLPAFGFVPLPGSCECSVVHGKS